MKTRLRLQNYFHIKNNILSSVNSLDTHHSIRFSGWRQILWVVVYPLLEEVCGVGLTGLGEAGVRPPNTFLHGPS